MHRKCLVRKHRTCLARKDSKAQGYYVCHWFGLSQLTLRLVLACFISLSVWATEKPPSRVTLHTPTPEEQALAIAKKAGVPSSWVSYPQDYKHRHYYGARLEPKRGVIHGAGQDPGSYAEYSNLFPNSLKPLMYMTYITITAGEDEMRKWQQRVQKEIAGWPSQPTVLQIGLNMTAGKDDGTGSAKWVAKGRYDAAINAFIEALKSFNVPAYVRIGYEFEGDWNNYTPEGFVSAFRVITDKIRAAELDEVATVWCAAGGSAGFVSQSQLMSYYPGDEYVDWWGVDIFSPEEIPHAWLGQFYEWADQHRKPVMIGEATPRYVGAFKNWQSWRRWYQPFFAMVREYPQIKAISYINWDWAHWSKTLGFEWYDWEDARIQKDELLTELYRTEMKNPIWIHANEKAAILTSSSLLKSPPSLKPPPPLRSSKNQSSPKNTEKKVIKDSVPPKVNQ